MKVAILGHLLANTDYKKLPFGRHLPLGFLKKAVDLIPDEKKFALSSHFDILGKTDGYVVSIALTPEQMMNLPKERVRKIILHAIIYIQNKLKCDLVMLGALTAPVTAAGVWLRQQPGLKLRITTGNTFTVAVAIQEVKKAMELAEMDKSSITMAVVGAAGVIGSGISTYFNEHNYNLILVEKSIDRFSRLKPQLKGNNCHLTDKLIDINNADIVIAATAHPDALIGSQHLKHGAIVVDVAEPPDVVADINKARPDVIHIDGGRVKWQTIDLGVDVGLPERVGFACITEGIMQALEDDRSDHIGAVDRDFLAKTVFWGRKWNFEIADFTSFNEPVLLERFNKQI